MAPVPFPRGQLLTHSNRNKHTIPFPSQVSKPSKKLSRSCVFHTPIPRPTTGRHSHETPKYRPSPPPLSQFPLSPLLSPETTSPRPAAGPAAGTTPGGTAGCPKSPSTAEPTLRRPHQKPQRLPPPTSPSNPPRPSTLRAVARPRWCCHRDRRRRRSCQPRRRPPLGDRSAGHRRSSRRRKTTGNLIGRPWSNRKTCACREVERSRASIVGWASHVCGTCLCVCV